VRVGEFLARPAGRLMPAAAAGRQAAPGRAATDVKEAGQVPASPVTASPVTASPVPEPPLHELLLASVPVPVLRSSRERLLGPVREYDTRHNADLLPTLRSFLACDGSWSACASRMYVHVNTVRYRISRIEALTGRDLSALADRVDFFLALRG
jgi:hypothetical protein